MFLCPPPTTTTPVQVTKLSKGEVLMLNIGSMCTGARVLAVKHDLAKLQLTSPGERVSVVCGGWRHHQHALALSCCMCAFAP